MTNRHSIIFVCHILFFCIATLSIDLSVLVTPACSKEKIIFGGGPAGGTFQVVANAIQTFRPIKDAAGFKVQVQLSNGSVENLKNTDSGIFQMGIVYSGDLWQGSNGKLSNDTSIYSKVMAVAYLYSAPAQLVVKADSGIKGVKDLEGKKVGVGNRGSGAHSTCELFFTHMGLWDKIEKKNAGYNDASYGFKNNDVDAFWVLSALPCPAVTLAAETREVGLVNLADDARKSDFLKEFPWFSTVTIKGGVYKGIDSDTFSFQDSAILVASQEVSDDLIYQILSVIYADDGLAYLAQQNENLKEMSVATGIIGIVTSLHPGATKFWKEKGIVK
ncbi:MAG: TAXI family TRAP transporter solute-binding subunit, partial [Desulfamplus sp.]|nr:TAXI family TRAP transporter solute-binding subunit [Desulfamplus sp.]